MPTLNVHTLRIVVLLAGATAALASTCIWEKTAKAVTIETVACYVALANDLTPLIDIRMADAAANAPECNSDRAPARATDADPSAPRNTAQPQKLPQAKQQPSASDPNASGNVPIAPRSDQSVSTGCLGGASRGRIEGSRRDADHRG